MKFKVPSKAFYTAASAVSKVINSKNVLEILNNFLLTLESDKLTILGSDQDNTLSAVVDVTEAQGEGKFCIDARRLVELLREMPEQSMTFEVNDDTLAIEISYPGGNYTLVGIDGASFPIPVVDDRDASPVEFSVPAEQITKGIDHTLFAVSSDDFRPQMTGIFFDIHPEDITFVSTDTRKLVRYINRLSAPGVETSFILPVKPSSIIKNIYSKKEETLHFSVTPKRALVKGDTFTFSCPFIKGNFPDYNRVIPKNNPFVLTIDRQSLLTAVRRVGVFIEAGVGLVRFRITPDKVYLKSQDNSLCTTAREEVACDYEGNELVIGFSAPFLIEIFNTLPTQDIEVRLSDPGRPGVFCPTENEEKSELLMLLMPMAIIDF